MTMTEIEQRLATLEAAVRRLSDIEEIRALRLRYHEYVNTNRPADIPDLFTEDAELDFGYLGRTRGRQKITKFFAALPVLLDFVKQFIHNHAIEVDGDRATGVSYLEAKSVSRGQAYRVAGRYDDVCVRTSSGWVFSSMKFEPYFTVPFDQSWAQSDLLQMGRRQKGD
jgi:ketosteroid isomerase-like protein